MGPPPEVRERPPLLGPVFRALRARSAPGGPVWKGLPDGALRSLRDRGEADGSDQSARSIHRFCRGGRAPVRALAPATRETGAQPSAFGLTRASQKTPGDPTHERKICSSRKARSSSRICAARSKSSSFAARFISFSSSEIRRESEGASGRSGRDREAV